MTKKLRFFLNLIGDSWTIEAHAYKELKLCFRTSESDVELENICVHLAYFSPIIQQSF